MDANEPITTRPVQHFMDSILGDRSDGRLTEEIKEGREKIAREIANMRAEELEELKTYEPLSEKDLDLYKGAITMVTSLASPRACVQALMEGQKPHEVIQGLAQMAAISTLMALHLMIDNRRMRDEREHLGPILPEGISVIDPSHLADGTISLGRDDERGGDANA